MNKYVHTKCSRCDKQDSVSVKEIITRDFKVESPLRWLPKDWEYRDIGDVGEESYILCSSCKREYQNRELGLFRNFLIYEKETNL